MLFGWFLTLNRLVKVWCYEIQQRTAGSYCKVSACNMGCFGGHSLGRGSQRYLQYGQYSILLF